MPGKLIKASLTSLIEGSLPESMTSDWLASQLRDFVRYPLAFDWSRYPCPYSRRPTRSLNIPFVFRNTKSRTRAPVNSSTCSIICSQRDLRSSFSCKSLSRSARPLADGGLAMISDGMVRRGWRSYGVDSRGFDGESFRLSSSSAENVVMTCWRGFNRQSRVI